MGELQYAVNQGKQAAGLPGVYKLGGWYATTDFADQHFGLDGAGGVVSLADPAAVGPLNHRGNGGIYGVADQMVWRADKTEPQPVPARRLCAVRPQSGLVLCRWRRRRQRSAARPRRRHAHLRRRLRQDQHRRRGARSGHARAQRAALSDPRPRGGVRAELSGADRAVVDRAAGPAIHRPPRRQRARPEQSEFDRRQRLRSPACAARSSSNGSVSAFRCRRAPRGSG